MAPAEIDTSILGKSQDKEKINTGDKVFPVGTAEIRVTCYPDHTAVQPRGESFRLASNKRDHSVLIDGIFHKASFTVNLLKEGDYVEIQSEGKRVTVTHTIYDGSTGEAAIPTNISGMFR